MSSRMMTLAAQYAPRQEAYSIDECFLDFEGVGGDLVGIGRELRATVLKRTGLPTNVGLGPTKTPSLPTTWRRRPIASRAATANESDPTTPAAVPACTFDARSSGASSTCTGRPRRRRV